MWDCTGSTNETLNTIEKKNKKNESACSIFFPFRPISLKKLTLF